MVGCTISGLHTAGAVAKAEIAKAYLCCNLVEKLDADQCCERLTGYPDIWCT